MTEFRGRITIDGKGTFDYVATMVENGAAKTMTMPGFNSPVNIPPDTQRPVSTGDGEVFSGMLLKHEMKAGVGKDGRPWEKHSFRTSDNRWAQTFDEQKVAQLSPVVGQGTPVKLVLKPNAFKSHDIVRILGA